MYSNKKSASTPESPKGVGFFNHFPTNFLRPYSVADPRARRKHCFSSDQPKILRVAHTAQNRYERVCVNDHGELGVVGQEKERLCKKAKVSCHAGNACTFFWQV